MAIHDQVYSKGAVQQVALLGAVCAKGKRRSQHERCRASGWPVMVLLHCHLCIHRNMALSPSDFSHTQYLSRLATTDRSVLLFAVVARGPGSLVLLRCGACDSRHTSCRTLSSVAASLIRFLCRRGITVAPPPPLLLLLLPLPRLLLLNAAPAPAPAPPPAPPLLAMASLVLVDFSRALFELVQFW